MYEKDGEKYFVVDGHIHLWDGSPANQKNKYGKGFIECFYDYHKNLSPEEYVWPLDEYEKYAPDRLVQDLFVDGHVDVGIFLPTILGDFYVNGFFRQAESVALVDQYPGRFVLNGSFDPRDEEAGLERLAADKEKYDIPGVKLYTAEWRASPAATS
jgi:predicted TIM-barrel fold metal-dependent hydrolase